MAVLVLLGLTIGCTSRPPVAIDPDLEAAELTEAAPTTLDCKGGCDDGNACTKDVCSAGGCTNSALLGACDDGSACTVGGLCQNGACATGKVKACIDGNACTKDSCDTKAGCVFGAIDGACDDGDACTTGDACAKGGCVGAAKLNCDDGNGCTIESCEAKVGCVVVYEALPCDDGDACTIKDACDHGVCKSGAAKSCDDGSACTVGEACKAGACIVGVKVDCGDGEVCTTDSCDPVKGCQNVANTLACDDGDKCTALGACDAGACKAGAKVTCDDGNTCTADACSPNKGCANVAAKGACEDGSACTTGDTCSKGVCVAKVNDACTSCGDGKLQAGVGTALICQNKAPTTFVKSAKELMAWRANPTTRLTITGPIALGGKTLDIVTPCNVTIEKQGSVTGAENVYVAAQQLTVYGALGVAGTLYLRTATTIELKTSSSLLTTPQSVAIEANHIELGGKLAASGQVCAEGHKLAVGASGSSAASIAGSAAVDLRATGAMSIVGVVASKAAVSVQAGTLSVGAKGGFMGATSLSLSATKELHFKGRLGVNGKAMMSASGALHIATTHALSAAGRITLNTAKTLHFASSVQGAGELFVKATTVQATAAAKLVAVSTIDVSATGDAASTWAGTITGAKQVVIAAKQLQLPSTAQVVQSKQVAVMVSGKLAVAAGITGNQSVLLQAASYHVNAGASFKANGSCSITGKKLDGSADPAPCVAVAK